MSSQPLQSLDQWDDFVASRYRLGKSEEEFRQYSPETNPGVAEFYRQNHAGQTVDFVRGSAVPTALIVAGRDTIVPPRRSAALRAAIPNLVFEVAIDAGHNDLYGRSTFAAAMREALARIGAASGRAVQR